MNYTDLKSRYAMMKYNGEFKKYFQQYSLNMVRIFCFKRPASF